MYLEKSASVALAAVHALNDVPGWLTERLFHTDAVECPWTTTPANDTQCQERQTCDRGGVEE
ncbi:hypothetical protein, variant [Sphaeroforma arctica JP610]|uniref:Uncharacterized protein n=1 Tax=Sphaeroforma arctica JP610 TaxID=667725 RepID=A0A0L0GEG2_9EUKA|nr:hypothetical protein, variant [Sphaeroforma arctica JP610]KNC87284.1 hypothetical protein, variant [Sphaeroforma arctica JP610]|eukprot:XP_014161187.1 hypothetical protein, variant [Sphaeroforma arctica JP610]